MLVRLMKHRCEVCLSKVIVKSLGMIEEEQEKLRCCWEWLVVGDSLRYFENGRNNWA